MARNRFFGLLALILSTGLAWASPDAGRINGKVMTADERPVEGVSVALSPLGRTTITNPSGTFSFANVPAGSYEVSFSLGKLEAPAASVEVSSGETTTLERTLEWDFSFAETMTVTSASKRRERRVEAPSAMTLVTEEQIALEGGSGQLPELLRFTVGALPTQSGLWDYNFNTRGWNGYLTRRVQTLVDGRDVSIPASHSQEWWAIAALGQDLESMELVRGPSAALYGPNTVSGVLSLRTKAPKDSLGGTIRVGGGDLDTFSGDFRIAESLGNDWYIKVLGSHEESESFTQDRHESVEYEGVFGDVVPLPLDGLKTQTASLRIDKYLDGGSLFTLEGGIAEGAGETYLTTVGRFQELDVDRWWARFNFNSEHWNVMAWYNDRIGDQIALQAGVPLANDESSLRLEVQANQSWRNDTVRLTGGVSYGEERVDSALPNGVQTLYSEAISTDAQAVFAQVEWDAHEKLKLVGALRWDDSTLHDAEISPKVSLVWQPTPNHGVRVSYNKAFQLPTYTEFFLAVPAGLPFDFSAVESQLETDLGKSLDLGLDSVGFFAFGNEDLEVEAIRSFEVGYTGILGDSVLLNIDYYQNRIEDFVGNLFAGVNPAYGPYTAPEGLSDSDAEAIENAVRGIPGIGGLMTNGADGEPLAVVSVANAAVAKTRGLEFALSWQASPLWMFDGSYSYFEFEIEEQAVDGLLAPNAPGNQASVGVTFRKAALALSLRHRWVDAFDWASGNYVGPVQAYNTTSFSGSYEINDHWKVSLSVSNLFNEEHYQAFGGDLLGRRAILHVAARW